jgi:hypothetical protein
MNICIIGAGTYGCYVIDSLLSKYPKANITLFDVGDSSIKSEEEIGLYSSLKKAMYTGLTDGRWFGFGGTSNKWGGQLLTFTENDFENPDNFMQEVIQLNQKHKVAVLKKFNIKNDCPEKYVSDGLFTKTGVWLSAFDRSFFKYFKISKRKQVKIVAGCRVSKFITQTNNKIHKVIYIENGIEKEESFDYYFLTAGAFESSRILLSSNLRKDRVSFSDHLSQKVFKVKRSTKIGDEDFVFKLKGFSLITKRLIGEIDGFSFYAHPVFNMDFPFFQSIKMILFKKQFTWKAIKDVFKNTPQVVAFIWSVLVKKKMFVLNNEWCIYIDIENPTKDSFVTLSEEKDAYGIHGLDVTYAIGEEADIIYTKAKELTRKYLIDNQVDFETFEDVIDVRNSEDIYHPYLMNRTYNSVDDYFSTYENMLAVSTGILPRIGGINPTAAVLPLIDEFIESKFLESLN